MKKIVFKLCEDCPYYKSTPHYDYNDELECTKINRHIEDDDAWYKKEGEAWHTYTKSKDFPDWCPLEDV
jgi:hypothetical protein